MGRVQLVGVTKRFGDVSAVDDLDLDVHDREFLVLLGPSGCGKSTVLRLIAGLEVATSGSISIGDRVVDDVDAVDRDIAMVFQSYALYPHMTVWRNIEFPLRARRIDEGERARLVEEASRALDLTDLWARRPAQLSGGQRQRVALARAIVRRPAAFLMDEPLSNLDAKLRVQTRAELVELRHRLQSTILYVTHDQVEAMTMGDRVAVLDRGRLQQLGAPQEVYDRPANLFVASFIGTPPMNTLHGRVVAGEDGDVAVSVSGAKVPLPDDIQALLRRWSTTEVVVGVRPEHVDITAPDGGLRGVVVLVESLGHERHVVCRLPDGQLVIVRQLAEEPAIEGGTNVSLVVDPRHTHLFDSGSGARIEGAA